LLAELDAGYQGVCKRPLGEACLFDRSRRAPWQLGPRSRDRNAVAAADEAFHTAIVAYTSNARMMRWYEELRLALMLLEQRHDDLGRAETEASRTRNDHRALAKALQGFEDVGLAALREHLADGAAELHRLRKLLRERS
jgi:DNA-binding FadR family transcriptional regulator